MSYKITFQSDNVSIFTLPSTSLLVAAGEAGIVLTTPCGGKGTCKKCRIRVLEGKVRGEMHEDYYLACKTYPESDCVVDVPKEARFYAEKILTDGVSHPLELSPNISKHYIRMKGPDITDQIPDSQRLLDEARKVNPRAYIGTGALIEMAKKDALRKNNFEVTIILDGDEIINVTPGDTRERLFGVAFDIGTTTVVGKLIDLLSGDVQAVVADANPQKSFGDDVISRIEHARSGGLGDLQKKIIDCLNAIILKLTEKAGIPADDVLEVIIAANNIMIHLLLGLNPERIAEAPYIPVIHHMTKTKLKDLGITGLPCANLYTLPSISGYVGADITAAILASGMHEDEGIRLLIDVGTNGEIALGNRDKMMVCSTAAGPAFEGARISCGMRGTEGAIEKVIIRDDVEINVIGNKTPLGICGTGLIDTVGELIKTGIIDNTGRIQAPDEINALPEKVMNRLIAAEGGYGFVLYEDKDRRIILTQRDVRELQLAQAAIRAGIDVLMKRYGVEIDGLTEILIAGTFGNYIRRSQARRINLLPRVSSDKIRYIGNAASEGAVRVLLSKSCRKKASELAEKCKHIELSMDPDFQMAYMTQMTF